LSQAASRRNKSTKNPVLFLFLPPVNMFAVATSSVVLREVRIVSPTGIAPPQDIWVEAGVIKAIGQRLEVPLSATEYSFNNGHVSIGWFDLGTHVCDPGLEHREDLHTAAAAARAGGYVALACMPNTLPALHTKSEILYVKNKSALGALSVEIYPMGAISTDCKGKDIAELYDMHQAGAVAFTDGDHPVQDAGLLLRSLQYVSAFDGLIINQPLHQTISAGGQMHEGLISTELGLKGIPALAEELMVQRDLSLLAYAEGGRLHIHNISTSKSVELIRAAKAAGLPVTASVAIANLCFTDEVLSMTHEQAGFDSHWKLMPPLRAQSDREALLEGLLDGTIDCICSNHTPCDEETKNLEFPYADFGMVSLQSTFALACTHLLPRVTLSQIITWIAVAPRRILRLPVPEVAEGQPAALTLFDPEAEYIFDRHILRSRSKNTPLDGHSLRGVVFTD
jgi:dihydroorotase